MLPSQSSGSFDPERWLAEMLREQGVAPEESAGLLPALLRLDEWSAPRPSLMDTQQLLAQLAHALPSRSPVRQAIRERQQRPIGSIIGLLDITRTQVSLFGLSFWLVSALITFVGAVAVLSAAGPTSDAQQIAAQEIVLRASGPLLACLGTVIAFRGTGAHVLECELVCLPTPLQLALARLVIVLGYDITLGLALCLALVAGGAGDVLMLMLSWFMPLLLVVGLALLLSLRLSIQTAASVAYGSWLAILALGAIANLQNLRALSLLALTSPSETLLGSLGVALLAAVLLRLRANLPHLLPTA
ncbi:MAG TPA: hypothetical protein VFU88_12695 [Ktedonobacterales bacterium]|nr:hypothetical protein [Ktedonobacterales bacterium]